MEKPDVAAGSLPSPATIPIVRGHEASSTTNQSYGPASAWSSRCLEHQQASLKCIEQNYGSKSTKCRELFEKYKACRREEHAAILKARNPDGVF